MEESFLGLVNANTSRHTDCIRWNDSEDTATVTGGCCLYAVHGETVKECLQLLLCSMTSSRLSTCKLDTSKCAEYDLAPTEQKRIKARAQMTLSSFKAASKKKERKRRENCLDFQLHALLKVN